jgi:hypothetical protein
MHCEGFDGKGETHVERHCDNCEHPNSSLLRVVLIGEIIRADEADLYMIAEVFDELGLLDLSDEDEPPSDDSPPPRTLHRIK